MSQGAAVTGRGRSRTSTCGRTERRERRCGDGQRRPASAAGAFQVTSLHTLGPAGTNCELAARRWFARSGRPGQVVLHRTLEEAAAGALAADGGALLVPAAYPELHTLVYTHVDELAVADTIVVPTYPMVLARRPGGDAIATVASHPAPVALVPKGLDVRRATSNSQAAADCASGQVDACITTAAAMDQHGLELVKDFGPVPMAFTIHVRRDQQGSRTEN